MFDRPVDFEGAVHAVTGLPAARDDQEPRVVEHAALVLDLVFPDVVLDEAELGRRRVVGTLDDVDSFSVFAEREDARRVHEQIDLHLVLLSVRLETAVPLFDLVVDLEVVGHACDRPFAGESPLLQVSFIGDGVSSEVGLVELKGGVRINTSGDAKGSDFILPLSHDAASWVYIELVESNRVSGASLLIPSRPWNSSVRLRSQLEHWIF